MKGKTAVQRKKPRQSHKLCPVCLVHIVPLGSRPHTLCGICSPKRKVIHEAPAKKKRGFLDLLTDFISSPFKGETWRKAKFWKRRRKDQDMHDRMKGGQK